MEFASDILIVDDSKEIAALVADLLIDEGYRVRTALTPGEALVLIAECRPELALIDLYMPNRIGDTFAREINNTTLPAIPVIIMTADMKAAEELSMEGIAGCLTKPFDLDELVARVAEHVHQECVVA